MYGRVKVGKINEDRHLYLWTDQTDNEKFELVIPKWRKVEWHLATVGSLPTVVKGHLYILLKKHIFSSMRSTLSGEK